MGIPGISDVYQEAKKQALLEAPELQFVDLGRWLDAVRRHFDRYSSATNAAGDNVKAILKKIGIRRWSRFWHYGRQLIPLQHRLLIEQVYSDLGEPWSQFLTGFGPLTDLVIDGDTLERERAVRAPQRAAQRRRRLRGARYNPNYASSHGGR